jgi:integrase
MKLTVKELAKHKPEDKADYIVFDDNIAGFGLRFRKGRQSWIFQYAIGTGPTKVTRRMKIGDYPTLSPGKAREEAEDLHAKLHLHGDPAVERRKNRIDARNTLGNLVEQYLRFKKRELRARSFKEVERHLEVHARPLHALPLASVDQSVIAQRLSTIAEAGAVAANRTRSSLSAMFVWAMGEGLAAANPVANTNRREEKSRDRVLSDVELRALWFSLDADDFGDIIKLLILTGQRKSEIAGLQWSEISDNVITLPAHRTKNARAHEIPMTSSVKSLLAARKLADRDFIFGRGAGPFSGWSKAKAALDKRAGTLKPWTVHDIRRTVATRMADIGVQPHVIEAVLNHVSGHKGGIAGIYNRAQYSAEKADALTRWDKHITKLVDGRRSTAIIESPRVGVS